MNRTPFLSEQQAKFIKAFNGQVYISETLDIQSVPLWDSFHFLQGQTLTPRNAALFVEVAFSSTGKTRRETNLYQPQVLAQPEAFSVEQIRFVFSKETDPAEAYRFAESATFEFWLGKKTYAEKLIAGCEPYKPTCPHCAKPIFDISNPEYPLKESEIGLSFVYKCDPRLVIANQQSFWMGLEFTPFTVTGERLSMWCFLEGLYARGVS